MGFASYGQSILRNNAALRKSFKNNAQFYRKKNLIVKKLQFKTCKSSMDHNNEEKEFLIKNVKVKFTSQLLIAGLILLLSGIASWIIVMLVLFS